MKPDPGTYQTTFRVEKWERKRKTPRVQYRTTFGGPVIDHNDILTLVRKLHASEDGKVSALIEVFKKAEKFDYWQSQEPTTAEWLTEYRALEGKLEAIKTLFLPLPEWVEWEFNTPMSIDSSKMLSLRGILKGEDLQTSDETGEEK